MGRRTGHDWLQGLGLKVEAVIKRRKAGELPPYHTGLESTAAGGTGAGIEPFRVYRCVQNPDLASYVHRVRLDGAHMSHVASILSLPPWT